MSRERREYFRIRTAARVRLRRVPADAEEAARLRVCERDVPAGLAAGGQDESGFSAEARLVVALLRHIALGLDRLDRRLEAHSRANGSEGDELLACGGPVEISLSASGFAGPFGLELPDKALVELELDLADAGLPPVLALARHVGHERDCDENAFEFDAIHPDDRERLVALALRRQSRALRSQRAEEDA